MNKNTKRTVVCGEGDFTKTVSNLELAMELVDAHMVSTDHRDFTVGHARRFAKVCA